MTALAELRGFSYQQIVVVRSVNQVTVQAVRLDRRVLEPERSPLFRMAFVAEFVYGIGPEHLGSDCPVRIMTVSAADLALPYGVVGLFVCLQPYVLVAVEAEAGLRRLQALVAARMYRVAVGACDAV
jgi:hypothetical protein